MSKITFYKICNHYVVLPDSISTIDNGEAKYTFLKKGNFDSLINLRTYSSSFLKKQFDCKINLYSNYYFFIRIKNGFCLYPVSNFLTYLKFICIRLFNQNTLKNSSKCKIPNFRLAIKQKLLVSLLKEKITIKKSIEAFKKFVYCDHYSFWVYSSETDTFTNIASSQKFKKNYIERSSGSSLYDFLESSKPYEKRSVNYKVYNSEYYVDMNSVNRIRIEMDSSNQEIGVLSYYSCISDFYFIPKTYKIIKNFLETKYSELILKEKKHLHNTLKYMTSYRAEKLEPFLCGLVNEICQNMSYEACSIFLKNPKTNELDLVAISDRDQKGKPSRKVKYVISEKTFTTTTYKTEKMQWSYDIFNDPKNSHTFNEKTTMSPENWICYPLINENQKDNYGVIRVKNKYINKPNGEISISPFNYNDFKALSTIKTYLSNILSIEEKNKENERNHSKAVFELQKSADKAKESCAKFEKSYNDLEHFNKLFLHEIRTPISTFSTSPMIVGKLLKEKPIREETLSVIKNKILDIKIMGERLAFIANTYYFDDLIKPYAPKKLFAMKDIIYPVINISRPYVQKQYNIKLNMEFKNLESQHIYGDKILLNIAFHSLINNAGKYTPKGKEINISGRLDKDSGHFFIIVSNDGYPIKKHEMDKIFKSGYRGKQVESMKIGGTGIGLYLSKEIMLRQNGDLSLTSCKGPVTFEMKIPIEKNY